MTTLHFVPSGLQELYNSPMKELLVSQDIYSVSQLNLEVRQLLEEGFPAILVQGEISNLRKPASGHFYFSLKDECAQVRCAMFRMKTITLPFEPREGLQVLVRARISLYEERGEFQLVVEAMEEAGEGALRRAFDQLKQRLAREGLFNSEYKKQLPIFPQCIGVVTSPTGAAIRDILTVLKRRFPCIKVIVYPTPVQGHSAAPQIVKAINTANHRKECQVIIVARGGGSLEDLWPFNEEVVARAIFASEIPIVTGIGHEIDFTIADFVADKRAATPSAAAELISPNISHIIQKIDHIETRLINIKIHFLQNRKAQVDYLLAKLQRFQPQHYLHEIKNNLHIFSQQLNTAIQHQIKRAQQNLANLTRALSAVSPLNTLQRGYAIAMQEEKIITDVKQVNSEKPIDVQLKNGKLRCVMKK